MTVVEIGRVPVFRPATARPSGWWGVVGLIATESMLFVLAIAAYFYLRTQSRTGWPPAPLHDPEILKPLGANLLLVVSCIPLVAASRAVDAGNAGRARAWLVLTTILGLGFVALQIVLDPAVACERSRLATAPTARSTTASAGSTSRMLQPASSRSRWLATRSARLTARRPDQRSTSSRCTGSSSS